MHIPIVLHFTITDWAAAFSAALGDLGLDEASVKNQVTATLELSLAEWGYCVWKARTAAVLSLDTRWLIESYVTEAVRIGYLQEQSKSIESILKMIHNFREPSAEDSDDGEDKDA